MDSSRRTLLTSVAIIVALGAGFAAAKLMEHHAPAAKEAGEKGEGAEKGEGGEAREKGEAGSGDTVKLTADQSRAAGITVVAAQLGGAADLRLSGRVEAAPDARAAVASPVAGAVQQVLVAPGRAVGAGAPLVIIRSAEGADLSAQAVAANAEAEAARLAAARDERLLKEGVIARQDWETSRATAIKAQAGATAARARAAASGSPSAGGQTVVRSPIRGVVTTVQVAPGGFVAQGGAVTEVVDPARVEVVFNATPEAAAKVRPGAHVMVTDSEGAQVDAVITGVAPLASDQTGASVLRARPSGPGLRPGAAVTALIGASGAQLPTVPTEAVQTVGGRSAVFVQAPGGFKLRPVTPGASGGGVTQIVSGLSAGERVAGRGAFLLKAELSKGEAKDED